MLKYLNHTKCAKLKLIVESTTAISWFVDASDNTHMVCKDHTGAIMMLGEGAVIRMSNK